VSTGLYSGVSGLALGTGLYKGTLGLWGGASGLINQFGATLALDFLAGAPLDSRITFTRSTTATFVGSNGLLQSSAINAPRFDYNPVTLAPRGLLIEEQRVNLVLYSEQFDNVLWIKSNTTVTANATTSPDGTTTADKLLDNAVNASHAVNQVAVAAAAAGVSYNFSVFLKAAERGFAFVGLGGASFTAPPFVSIDLATGVVASANGAPTNFSATSFGNGWWRLSFAATTQNIGSLSPEIRVSADGLWANRVYIGNGTGIFVWGAQLEAATFATSYIPTVASTVTRAVDNATMTGTNFSSWYNASEGTIVVSADSVRPTAASPATRVFQFDDGTTANSIRSAGTSTLTVVNATALQAFLTPTPVIPFDGTVFKFASAYKENDFASVTTGAVATDTSGTVPTITQLAFGSGIGAGILNGHIRTLTYYPQRLANAQLQALTA